MTTEGRQPGRSAPLDWPEVHRRVAALRTTLERGTDADPDEVKRVLRERAAALARQAPEAVARNALMEVLEFSVGDGQYGIETSFVEGVHTTQDIAALPCVPDFIAGIVNVRGRIVSTVDLRPFLGLPGRATASRCKVIVLGDGSMEFGVLADAILGVAMVARKDLQAVQPLFDGGREHYVHGVAAGRLVVLDAERLLIDPRLRVNETTGSLPAAETG